MAMREVPLVGGPVELRGALDVEITQAGVMPRRLLPKPNQAVEPKRPERAAAG